jgi:3D (Asp-Asp-Asp) domain-containing protein
MDNLMQKSLFSSAKTWFVSAIVVCALVPSVTLANSSQENYSYTSLDHYLAMYYKQNKVKELKDTQKGKEMKSVAKISQNSQIVTKKALKTNTIDQLEKEIMAKKTKKTVISQVAGKKAVADPKPDRFVKAVITAYTSTPDQTDSTPDIAASGKHVYDGMIAANWLPFGTKVKIPALYGDKIFTVDDRMNKRYGYGRMDVWLDTSKAEARKFGVKRVEIEVYYKDNTKKIVLAK